MTRSLAEQRLAAIQRLTRKQLDAYRLWEARELGHHHMTWRDMATGLGITPGALHSRLTAARKHLDEGDA